MDVDVLPPPLYALVPPPSVQAQQQQTMPMALMLCTAAANVRIKSHHAMPGFDTLKKSSFHINITLFKRGRLLSDCCASHTVSAEIARANRRTDLAAANVSGLNGMFSPECY